MERKCRWNFTQPHSENTSAQTSPLISGEGCISDYGVTIVCPSASVHSVHHSLSLHKKKKQWARESALLWAVPRVPCGLSRSPFRVSLRQGYLAIRIHMYLLSQIHSTKGRLACPKDSNGPTERIRVRCYCLHRSRSILSSESRPFGVFSSGTRGGKETADTHRFRFLASAAVSAVAASLGRTAACRPRASSEVGRTFSRTTELASGAAWRKPPLREKIRTDGRAGLRKKGSKRGREDVYAGHGSGRRGRGQAEIGSGRGRPALHSLAPRSSRLPDPYLLSWPAKSDGKLLFSRLTRTNSP